MAEMMTFESFVEFLLILFISLIGSSSKTYMKIMYKPQHNENETRILKRYKIVETILSTLTGTVITFSLSNTIQSFMGARGLIFVSFIVGLVGFEVLLKLSSLKGLIRILKTALSLYQQANINTNDERKENDSDYDN